MNHSLRSIAFPLSSHHWRHFACRSCWRWIFIALIFLSATALVTRAEDVPMAFQPLKPGAVEPTGWLRDWALAAGKGITGHLDERAETYAKGWSGQDFKAGGVKEKGTGWPLEQCAYWLDGLVRMAYILNDPDLIAKAKSRLDPVVDGILKGGDSFVYWMPNSIFNDDGFNSWAHSHMGRALVAYYQASGDPRILEALVKVYRNFPLPDFQDDFGVVNGMVNLDPMIDTYLLSRDPQVLANVRSVLERPGFKKAVETWNSGKIVPGHAVIFYENERVPALLYPWTGDRHLLDATKSAVKWSDQSFLLPNGLVSGEEHLAGIGSTRNVETCNVAAANWTYLWLLRITGEGSYADRIEQIFFNAGPAPIARDFETMCYYQSPNRLNESLPLEEPHNPSLGSYQFTPIGHPCLCCVGNVSRVLPNYIMHMWMATPDHGLAATLYGPCRVKAQVADGVDVIVESKTVYPFEESIVMEVTPSRDAAFPVSLRIPAWCKNPEIQINDQPVKMEVDANGFVKLDRTWKTGDRIGIRFPMTPRLICGQETSYPDQDYFRQEEVAKFHQPRSRQLSQVRDVHNPFASVMYGPLLFALPIADETPNRVAPGAVWNYALNVDPRSSGIEVVRTPMPKNWDWSLSSPLRLRADAVQFDWKPTELQPLPAAPVSGGEKAKIELVPFGCTKFRVSMFPVTEKLWADRAAK
ncbi:MAG: hypothetical protein D4R65_01805 [Verrucomicrobiaceae bacterium]|nr:MAG: hypothetical protein D4R65_01805 [Verrucomicrobiaceae bacterium]